VSGDDPLRTVSTDNSGAVKKTAITARPPSSGDPLKGRSVGSSPNLDSARKASLGAAIMSMPPPKTTPVPPQTSPAVTQPRPRAQPLEVELVKVDVAKIEPPPLKVEPVQPTPKPTPTSPPLPPPGHALAQSADQVHLQSPRSPGLRRSKTMESSPVVTEPAAAAAPSPTPRTLARSVTSTTERSVQQSQAIADDLNASAQQLQRLVEEQQSKMEAARAPLGRQHSLSTEGSSPAAVRAVLAHSPSTGSSGPAPNSPARGIRRLPSGSNIITSVPQMTLPSPDAAIQEESEPGMADAVEVTSLSMLCDRHRKLLLEFLSAASKFRLIELPQGTREFLAVFKSMSESYAQLKECGDSIGEYGPSAADLSARQDEFIALMRDLAPSVMKLLQTSRQVALGQAAKTDFEADLVPIIHAFKALRASLDALVAAAPN